MKVERVEIAKLRKDPNNARRHSPKNIQAIKDSLARFGQRKPIVVDANNVILAGNGTLEAAEGLGWKKIDAVRCDLKGAEAVAFALADNRTAELATWDDAQLAKALKGLEASNAVAGLGFSDADVARALRGLGNEEQEEAAPEAPDDPITQPLDLWHLGGHRLMCGDATDADHVARLLGRGQTAENSVAGGADAGITPFLMVTDPPYGVEYDAAWRDCGLGDLADRRTGQVGNDDRVDWEAAWRLFTGDVAYVWHAPTYGGQVQATLDAAGFEVRSMLVWVKQHLVISRGHYHWQHEACEYAVRRGGTARWAGDRKETTVWQIANHGAFGGKADDEDTNHSTQKPLECMARPIRNHGERGDWVYDPFVGSGTTLIACEKLGRRCVAMEIDPGYCDVVVARWEKLTGRKALRGGGLAQAVESDTED